MEQASPDLLAIQAPAMLAFRVRREAQPPRLNVPPVCGRERGVSPSLDELQTWKARFPSEGERLARKDHLATSARWERGVLRPHLFGPRTRLPFQKAGGLLRGRLCGLRHRIPARYGLESYRFRFWLCLAYLISFREANPKRRHKASFDFNHHHAQSRRR